MITSLCAMSRAFDLARFSLKYHEFPVGAVIINKQGDIIAESDNQVERSGQAIDHAECLVLKNAAKIVGYRDLRNLTLVVTLEPCELCEAACELYRIGNVIFGAYNIKRRYKSPDSWIGGVMISKIEHMMQGVFDRMK